jgi:hypothetical protein
MLRLLALTLLLLNGVYFAWSQGLLLAYGFGPVAQSEPQRLAQQIQPEALEVFKAKKQLPLPEATKQAASKPAVCLQVGVFDEAQGARLRAALVAAQLPKGSWLLEGILTPGRWIVYMGKFANSEALAKKQAALANLKLQLQPLSNPALQPGLSLGGFDNQAAANTLLEILARRGVRTAQVIQEYPPVNGVLLRVPAADDALRARLDALKPALAGKSWLTCP